MAKVFAIHPNVAEHVVQIVSCYGAPETRMVFEWLNKLTLDQVVIDWYSTKETDSVTGQQVIEIPLWVVACWQCALNEGDLELDPKKFPHVRPDWRRFMLLLQRDNHARNAIEAAFRLAGNGEAVSQTTRLISNLKADLLQRIEHSRYYRAITYRQEIRARRIDYRTSPLANDQPIPRPPDEDFLREALPPRRDPR